MVRDEPYDRLQRARREAGFPGPAEAADHFGWNKNTYKSHENGMRGLRAPAAQRYGRAFHVSPAWLLTGEGEQDERPSPAERALLLKYRSLPEAGRAVVDQICDLLARGVVEIERAPAAAKRGRR